MNLTRRELKFQIPLALVQPISAYVEAYCEIDKYSARSHDGYYTINSLYLDNDNMRLLENKRTNMPRRFSMRIRSYGEQPHFPAFMEIKAKADMLINKRRAPISSDATIALIRDGCGSPEAAFDFTNPVMQTACFHIMRLGLKPKMMTQYRRKAYIGRFDTYSRVTFDKQLRCYPENQYNIFPVEEKFVNYDHEDQFTTGEGNVVLELKCELKVPPWLQGLIRKFQLRQAQFSKFDSSWSYLTDEVDPNYGSMSSTPS